MRSKTEPDGVKLLGKGHMENRKVKFRLGVVILNMRKQVELRMSQNGTEARLFPIPDPHKKMEIISAVSVLFLSKMSEMGRNTL